VHLGRPPLIWDVTSGWRQQVRIVFAAQHRAAIRLDPQGELNCLGVRLTPAASAALVSAQLPELRDRMVDLTAFAPELAAAFTEGSRCFDAAPGDLWALLEARLLPYEIDGRIESAVARLEASGGQARIAHLASAVAMSLRAFQTQFLDCVGLGAKEFARVLRLQAMIRALDGEAQSLSQAAQEAGFSDQPHATRELTRLIGTTPALVRSALKRERDGDDTIRLAAAFVRGHSEP
jgi:AraC-like DNA-binding protein